MNTIEKALMHALFLHLHHNIDKAVDFEAIEALNNQVGDITPEEIMICEIQGRMAIQVEAKDVDEILTAVRSRGPKAEAIGEISDDDKQVFEYKGSTVAVIPSRPSETDLETLTKET